MILAIGVLGASLVLLAFILLKTNKVASTDPAYDLLNFSGSLLLVINAAATQSYPFFIVNIFFVAVALTSLINYLQKGKKQKKK